PSATTNRSNPSTSKSCSSAPRRRACGAPRPPPAAHLGSVQPLPGCGVADGEPRTGAAAPAPDWGGTVGITAAGAHKPLAEFTLETLTLDAPRPGEVLVKVAAVGLCHSDLAAREGIIPVTLPAVLGHEGAGTVLEVGDGVTKVGPGDKVAL